MTTFEQEDLYRAAKALMNDRVTNEVLDRVIQRYVEMWQSSDIHDFDKRDDAYRMVRAVGDLRSELQALAAQPDVTAFNRRLTRGT